MKPDDLIEGGLIRDSDLDGEPSHLGAAELGPFGRYVLLEELGRGGAAIVYRALDPLLNRELALKRLRFGDLELETRFLREAELLARLSHAGIMPIFDYGREGDSQYYTMPLAPGLSLDRWMVERRPDAREAARIARQAAEALAHAHERGVLHRDLKPANILVSGDGNVLVGDFGLGRIEDPKAREAGRMTQSGEVMGTPSYMAPEFATGDLKGVDARCDVYGLGATLYELITGRPPFIGRSSLEILKRVTSEEPTPPRRLAPDAPVDLEIICLKALEKDPLRRYATSRELADDLGRFLAGEPIRARRASPLYRLRRFVGRRRAVVAVATAGVLIAAGIGLYAALNADEAAVRTRRVADFLEQADVHARAMNDLLRNLKETDPKVQELAKLAFEEIRKAMAEDPENADAHFQKGRVHSLLFEKDEARRSYDKAIRNGPVVRALVERAVLDCQDLMVLRAGGAAATDPRIRDLKKEVQRDFDAFMALRAEPGEQDFVKALLEMSKLKVEGFASAALLLEAHASKSRDWRAFYWKGVAELESRQFEKSRDSLETALEYRSNTKASALILDRLGVACGQLDKYEEAEKRFKLAIELNPELIEPKVHLASILMETSRFDEAIRLCDSALEVKPGSIQAHAVRGQCYVQKHRLLSLKGKTPELRPLLEAAVESLRIARQAFPPNSERRIELQKDLDYAVRNLEY